MKILLTGATGLVGRAIGNCLVERGHEIHAVIRNPTVAHDERFHVVNCDLLDAKQTRQAVASMELDAVVHAAGVMPDRAAVESDFFENVILTRNLLSALQGKTLPYAMFIGSIDVYAGGNGVLTEESAIGPATHYGLSKWVSEQFFNGWTRLNATRAGVLRLTHVYGPGDRGRKFIPVALRAIGEGQPVQVFGDGEDLRDFIHAEDVARIVELAITKELEGIMNVATGQSVSLSEIILILQREAGREVTVEFKSRRKSRMDFRIDNSKLIRELGVCHFRSINEGLRNLCQRSSSDAQLQGFSGGAV